MKRRTLHKRPSLNRKLISFAVASCFAAEFAYANPTGPSVAAGSASFSTVGSALTVTNSPNAIINWRGFSIGAGEATRFQQQSASSAVLNRVVGQDPSAILGTLWSNGKVFLINPNGILFGQGSRVDVGGLVASTLNITDGDFLGGRLNFQAGSVANSIVNQGELRSATGGHIYLVAPDVTNSGLISSPKGEVVLAAGKTVSLVDIGTPNLKVEVSASESEARNLGQIVADSGRIGVYAGLINQQGTVRADSVTRDATGKIVFRASDTATLGPESVISASGAGGGEIYVLARNAVKVAGRLDASAPNGGDGGFIETSAAHVHVDPAAVITTAAPYGKSGTWLVDPNDYTIASSGGDITGATLSSNLGTTSVIITSDQGASSGSGNINVNDTVSWSSPNSLTLLAHNNVTVNSPVTNGGTGSIVMVAGWIGPSTADFSVTPGTGDISIFRNVQTGGNLSLIAGNNVLLQGATVAATNGQTVDGSVTVSAQAISINAGGSITIAAGDNVTASATGPGTNVAVATSNATLSATTTIDLTAVGGITVRGGNGTAANASLQAAGSANNAATANANALVSAGTNLTISNAASVTLQAGSAQASAWKFAGGGATLSGPLSATANANTTLQAGNSITINGGDLQIDAGFAQARAYESVFSATGANLSGANTAVAKANVSLTGGTGVSISVTGNVDINGSSARASGYKNVFGGASNVASGTNSATAENKITLSATSGNLNITAAGLSINGNSAQASAYSSANGNGHNLSGANTATANSDIALSAAGNVALTLGSGGMTVSTRPSETSAYNNAGSGSSSSLTSNNTSDAQANISITAGNGLTIAVSTGSFSLGGSVCCGANASNDAGLGNGNTVTGNNSATGSSNVTLQAGGSLSVTASSISISAGSEVFARASHFATNGNNHVVGGNNTASQSARVILTAGGGLTLAATSGGIDISGGSADARARKNVAGGAPGNGNTVSGTNTATARGSVSITAGGNLTVSAAGAVSLTASSASAEARHTVNGTAHAVSGDNSALADSGVVLSAGGQLSISGTSLTVGGREGSASANKFLNATGANVTGDNTATAKANVALTGGTGLSINLGGGSMTVNGSSARASAYKEISPGNGNTVGGNDTATTETKITFTATSGTLSVIAGSLTVNASDARASAYKVVNGDNNILSGTNIADARSNIQFTGGSALTISLGSGAMTVNGSSARGSAYHTVNGNNNSVGGDHTAFASSAIVFGVTGTGANATISVGSLSVSGSSASARAYKTAGSTSTGNSMTGNYSAIARSNITFVADGTLSVAASGAGGVTLNAAAGSGAIAFASDTPNGNSVSGVNSADAGAWVRLAAPTVSVTLSNAAGNFSLTDGATSATGTGAVANASAELVASTAIAVTADNMDIAGSINAGTGTVTLAPFTTTRNVNVELSPTGGVLSLTPTELGHITAGTLVLGGTSGTLTVASGAQLNPANVANVTLIANDMNLVGTVTATGTVTLAPFTPGGSISIQSTDVGNPSTPVIGLTPVELANITAGTLAIGNANTGNIDIVGVTLSAPILNLSGANISVGTTSATTATTVSSIGAMTIDATGTLALQGANAGTGVSAVVSSGSDQVVNATTITVTAGAGGGGTGTGNSAALQSSGNQTISVGSGGLALTGGGGTLTDNYAAVWQLGGAGTTQTVNVGGGGSIVVQGGSSSGVPASGTFGSRAEIYSTGGSQQISFASGGSFSVTGGTNGSLNFAKAQAANGSQSITGATSIALTGGASGSQNTAALSAASSQDISVGGGGLSLTGGGGAAANNSAQISQSGTSGTQSITVDGGGDITLTGGSGSGNSNFARINANGTAQTIAFNSGGNLVLTGGTVGNLNFADVRANNGTLAAQTQTISGATGITLTGGASGGGVDPVNNNVLGNFARIQNVSGSQSISAGAGGLTLTGGGGSLTNNFALIQQGPTTGAPGTSQSLTISNGGALTLQGGSTAQTNVINNAGNFFRGSYAMVQANGDSQLFSFPSGGSISLTGGSVGSNNVAQILSRFGLQTISGAPSITLQGGTGGYVDVATNRNEGNYANLTGDAGQSITASSITLTGGGAGVGNHAEIFDAGTTTTQSISATSISLTGGAGGGIDSGSTGSAMGNYALIQGRGTQAITATGMSLQGGAGGQENFAAITAPTQTVTVHGNLSLVGGASATGTVRGGGARIGGPGGNAPGPTDLLLTVDGSLTMTGGSVTNAGSAIGSGLVGGQTTTMEIDVGGSVTLNPGTVANAESRIGSPASNIAGGDIAITAGGTLALNSTGPGLGTAIRTLGNVTINAASITQGPDSEIISGGLTTLNTTGGISLPGSNDFNQVTVGSASSVTLNDINAIVLNGITTSGGLAVSAGGAITQGAPLVVGGSSSFNAGANAITLTNASNDFTGAVSLTGSSASITDANALILGTTSLGGGSLIVNTSGAITQTGAIDAGAASFNAGSNPITLTNTSNDFTGAVSLTGTNVSIIDANTLTLGAVSATNLTATASTLNQNSSGIVTSGTTTLTAGTVTLNAATNDFGTVVVTSGGNVAITDANAITVGASSVGGTFDIIAASTTFLGAFSANNYTFSGGSYTLAAGTYNLGGTTTVAGSASVFMSSATINGAGGTFNVSGSLDTGTGTLTTGTLNVLAGGILKGTGTIVGNVINSAGTVSPGASPGILTINGNYAQGASGTLAMDIGGLSPGTGYDQLLVSGTTSLNGTLNTALIGSFVPPPGSTYTFIQSAGGVSGTFSTINQPVGALFDTFYGPTTFEFIAVGGGSVVPAPIEPSFNYAIVSIDQLNQPVIELIETILVSVVPPTTTTTPEGKIVPKPPACN